MECYLCRKKMRHIYQCETPEVNGEFQTILICKTCANRLKGFVFKLTPMRGVKE